MKGDRDVPILVTQHCRSSLSGNRVIMSRPGKITDIIDIPFKKRTPDIRTKPQFSKLVNEIAGKLRTWK